MNTIHVSQKRELKPSDALYNIGTFPADDNNRFGTSRRRLMILTTHMNSVGEKESILLRGIARIILPKGELLQTSYDSIFHNSDIAEGRSQAVGSWGFEQWRNRDKHS